ncbi:MAG TPA: signal peptidase II [Hyphomicrobiales bacterium]|nr:signal peptidase II [Kaistiaceae bacterium]HQF31516.1 signal peptidase II [Hyphomicrobiales bacterium]
MSEAGEKGLRVTGPLSRFGFLVAGLVFVLDQASKWGLLVGWDIAARGRVAIAPFVDFVLVWNRGVSYGLFQQDGDLGRWLLVAVTLVATVALTLWLARTANRLIALSIGLIVGGALANALDRIVHGAVVDFVLLHAGGFEWYVFNLADVAIVAGAAGLLYDSMTEGRKNAAKSG